MKNLIKVITDDNVIIYRNSYFKLEKKILYIYKYTDDYKSDYLVAVYKDFKHLTISNEDSN